MELFEDCLTFRLGDRSPPDALNALQKLWPDGVAAAETSLAFRALFIRKLPPIVGPAITSLDQSTPLHHLAVIAARQLALERSRDNPSMVSRAALVRDTNCEVPNEDVLSAAQLVLAAHKTGYRTKAKKHMKTSDNRPQFPDNRFSFVNGKFICHFHSKYAAQAESCVKGCQWSKNFAEIRRVSSDVSALFSISASTTSKTLMVPASHMELPPGFHANSNAIKIQDGSSETVWLADPGASWSLIPPTEEDIHLCPNPNETMFQAANGTPCRVYGRKLVTVDLLKVDERHYGGLQASTTCEYGHWSLSKGTLVPILCHFEAPPVETIYLRKAINERSFVPTSCHSKRMFQPDDIKDGMKTCSHVWEVVSSVKKPLDRPYKGPFKVLRRKQKYFIIDRSGKEDSVNVERLKPAFGISDSIGLATRSGRITSEPDRLHL
ncbi:hypothetical protein TCAL_15001 [Tigriopus californicus]|uniref:Peptidase A2 domain-containing protein n=1 Tax=Tigriopus californicus TaxID=6832 RepID=A0A553NY80_TIGCA|nr:hypothetical protein TCAL_15001 [Tigriopus californicus]